MTRNRAEAHGFSRGFKRTNRQKPQGLGLLGSFVELSSTGKSWQLVWGLPPAKARTQKANLSRLSLSTVAERTGRPMARPVRRRSERATAGVSLALPSGREGRTRRADTQHHHNPRFEGRSRAHEPRHPDALRRRVEVAPVGRAWATTAFAEVV